MAKTISNEKLKARICPNCGGKLIIKMEEALAKCQYCEMEYDVPISDELRKEYIKSKDRMKNEENKEKQRKEEKDKEKKKENNAKLGQLIAVSTALVLVIISVIMDATGHNGSLMELVGVIAMIASAVALGRKNSTFVEFVVSVLGGIATIIFSRFVENGSMLELGGGIAIIVVIVNYVKSMINKEEK